MKRLFRKNHMLMCKFGLKFWKIQKKFQRPLLCCKMQVEKTGNSQQKIKSF